MPGLALEVFERQAEAFIRTRAFREWQYQAGLRPGRSLVKLYTDDFPSMTSIELWADVCDAATDEPRHKLALEWLLANANLEGRTCEFASRTGRLAASALITFEDGEIPWREAPARWPLLGDVPRRHAMEEGWRGVLHADLNPELERWHEVLRQQLGALGPTPWLPFWASLNGLDGEASQRLADSVLALSADAYGHSLGVYLAQVGLPIDDIWRSDMDWAFRAARFDAAFPEHTRMPVLIRTFRDLGVDLEAQTGIHFEAGRLPGVHCLPVDIPHEVHVLLRLTGGYQDYLRSLRGLGMAQHAAQTDRTLPFWQRWLGDATPTFGYGALLEQLGRSRNWLAGQLDFTASEDYLVVSHIAWLARVRALAAGAVYERRLWEHEPGASLAADFEEAMGAPLRMRLFGDEYLRPVMDAPWSTLRPTLQLRGEVYAAQVRAFLRREFDDEWWRSARAAHFIQDELWRVGRRYTAEQLLGFMGYAGLDPAVLWSEFAEVLSPL